MQNRQEILESLKNIMPELRREFGVKSLGIFGSVATGDMNNDSDLDLLVEFEHPPGLRFMDFADKIEHSVQYCDGLVYDTFIRDHKTQDAVARNIEILGEAVKNIDPSFRSKHPDIPWKNIAGMRDKLIHDYFGVNFDVIWAVVNNDRPSLMPKLKALIPESE